MATFRLILCIFFWGLLNPHPLLAHKENCSFTFIEVGEKKLEVTFAISTLDLDRLLGIDQNRDYQFGEEEIREVLPFVEGLVGEKCTFSNDHHPVTLERAAPFSSEVYMAGAKYLQLHYVAGVPEGVNELVVSNRFFEVLGSQHKNFTRLMQGEKKQYAVFSDRATRVQFTPGAPLRLGQRLRAFLDLGMEHIFIGYDHILFLVALIAIGGTLMEMVKLVTAFTVAHSITLALASFQWVNLPGTWIEALIALSIVYVAIENFFIRSAKYRWVLTFGFGLIHGFGFANVLRDLHLPADGFAAALFSFNLGVEAGQLILLLGIFPVVWLVRRKQLQPYFNYGVSSVVLLFGWSWLLERVIGWTWLPF